MQRVLMIGNDSSVKGGITSIITQMLNFNWEKKNIEMTFIPSYKGGNAIFKSLYFMYAFAKIIGISLLSKPNIIHMHMSYRGSFSRKYVLNKWFRLLNIPVIIHLHGSEFKKWYDSVSVKKQNQIRLLLRESDSTIVLGEKWKKIIKEIEPNCKTVVVENSIVVPEYTIKWNSKMCRFLIMGVLIKRKGVHDLVEAVKNIAEQYPEKKFIFEIAGAGDEEISLKELIEEYNLQSYFEFTGWVVGEKKEECYRRSNVMILPSYNEGLPISILEAISYGMPVIATDVGDISSAVRDGENGYLFQPGDVSALTSAILKINDKDKYVIFSRCSKDLAITKFNDGNFFDRILNLYQKGSKE
ncbi:glycosyltransferase family 4 protein [Enterococcus faecium]|nr:glycosyltransferase family 4 protein [Enterococcus faecium]